jgi:hypothetical protein
MLVKIKTTSDTSVSCSLLVSEDKGAEEPPLTAKLAAPSGMDRRVAELQFSGAT